MGDVCHCPQPDFIERNGAWLITVIGMFTGCFGGVLTYFLKSRCHRIKCLCVECDRSVVEVEVTDENIQTTSEKPDASASDVP